jgi:hypothetical protein
MATIHHSDVPLEKRILAARIRADLAEKRIKRKELAMWTERSVRTVERWLSDLPDDENFRPTRAELLVVAFLTRYPLSRYTGDDGDDIVFPLTGPAGELAERLKIVEDLARREGHESPAR